SDPDTFFAALKARKSGVRRLSFCDPSALPCHVAGELPDFQPTKVITTKHHQKAFRMMARTVQMGLVVSTVAFRDAGLEVGKIEPDPGGGAWGGGSVACE